jgi:hypothetical protein
MRSRDHSKDLVLLIPHDIANYKQRARHSVAGKSQSCGKRAILALNSSIFRFVVPVDSMS